MPGKWPWFERHFTFDFPVQKYPDIIERLRGTPARAELLTRDLSPDVLTRREADTWSIQENVGHLADVEPLWLGRIDDMLSGAAVMREADLTNAKTFAADHHGRPLADVLATVHKVRRELIEKLESLTDLQWAKSSLHPRTKIQMRIVDLCVFVAEHDDYHLARITELKRMFR